MERSMEKRVWAMVAVVLMIMGWSQNGECSRRSEAKKENEYEEGEMEMKEMHRIRELPGQPSSPLPFSHYSGYVTVNETHGHALFYWFIEAMSQPSSLPLVLWLNGGPGCSSIGYGASQELGPFRVNKDGSGLTFNNFSWTRDANIIFLDSPVGVGFSYSNNSLDSTHFGDNITAEETYTFLIGWFEIFPEYKSHDFYLIGESYAGHYVPQLASLVYDRNKDSEFPDIKLKGFMVGNPSTDGYHDWVGIVEYAWTHAVISDQLYENVKTNCDFSQYYWTNSCITYVDKVFQEYNKINIYDLYVPICPKLNNSKHSRQLYRRNQMDPKQVRPLYLAGYDPCLDEHTIKYFNREDVQKAFHANVTNIKYPWTTCNDIILQNWQDSAFSILPIYEKLIEARLRIWVYSGDVDGRIPVTSTKYTLNALKLSIKTPWHAWYHGLQVAGWTQEFQGLVYVTIRGAGHLVPQTSPNYALALFSSFLASQSLPSNPWT